MEDTVYLPSRCSFNRQRGAQLAFTFFLQLPSFQMATELYPNRRREPR